VGGEGRATGADRAGHLHELEVVGVHGMAVRYYPALLRLVASGAPQPDRLIRRGARSPTGALAAMGPGGVEGITVINHF
jgi:alcohol dehydrogenase